MFDKSKFKNRAAIVSGVLEKARRFDPDYRLPAEEFAARQKAVCQMLREKGFDCGVVYSDEHYCGDVPYLAGNNNIIVEPIAAVLGAKGLYFIAGLESGIVAEQYCHRSGVAIRKVDILKVDSPNYPKNLTTVEEIVCEACGEKPQKIALLTTRGIFPLGIYNTLARIAGAENVQDISEEYYAIKYEKSNNEMRLIEESCLISDTVMEGMLRLLAPGMSEGELAGWGTLMARELGVEEDGFPIMVTSGINNKTIVAHSSNRIVQPGDIVHIGLSPKRDGLCGAQRTSVQCVASPGEADANYRLWMDFLEGAFNYGVEIFKRIARENLPGRVHEEKMIAYYEGKRAEMEAKSGLSLPDFAKLKGYVTTHNSGYTECQEFYGALACDFDKPLARQMVTMIDVGLQGFWGPWENHLIPGIDYLVIEKTAGKFGNEARILNKLPVNLQHFVGEGFTV